MLEKYPKELLEESPWEFLEESPVKFLEKSVKKFLEEILDESLKISSVGIPGGTPGRNSLRNPWWEFLEFST